MLCKLGTVTWNRDFVTMREAASMSFNRFCLLALMASLRVSTISFLEISTPKTCSHRSPRIQQIMVRSESDIMVGSWELEVTAKWEKFEPA